MNRAHENGFGACERIRALAGNCGIVRLRFQAARVSPLSLLLA